MPNLPLPMSPPLDGVPPSPPGAAAGGGMNPSLSQAVPPMDMSGDMQVMQLALQTAAELGKGLDLLGQMVPGFGPTAAMLSQQLRAGLRSALQQGVSASEPTAQASMRGMSGMMPPPQQTPGAVQQPLPPLNSGLGL